MGGTLSKLLTTLGAAYPTAFSAYSALPQCTGILFTDAQLIGQSNQIWFEELVQVTAKAIHDYGIARTQFIDDRER